MLSMVLKTGTVDCPTVEKGQFTEGRQGFLVTAASILNFWLDKFPLYGWRVQGARGRGNLSNQKFKIEGAGIIFELNQITVELSVMLI